MKTIITSVSAFSLLLLFGSCNFQDSKAQKPLKAETEPVEMEEAVPPALVNIKTADFVFLEVPDTISSGLTTFKVENQGAYPHNASIARLTGGHTFDEMMAYAEANKGHFPEWAVFIGGPSAPLSGGTSEATLQVYPGNYAIICAIPVPGGVPHFMKGMTKPLTVVEKQGRKATDPKEDLRLVMDDYSFNMTSKITAGTKTIKVENVAEQPHEFILARLDEGKTAGDLLNWFGAVVAAEAGEVAPAPGTFLNGVSPMHKGLVNYITVDFTPGEYALVCPIPDEADGKPHFAHGMVHQFTVE